MIRYTKKDKQTMIILYEYFKSYIKASIAFGCAMSTVYYAVNPDKYLKHVEYIRNKNK